MNEAPVSHPNEEQLAAFGLGRLSATDREAIESHVAGCGVCCERLESVQGDSLVELVQSSTSSATRVSGTETVGNEAGETIIPAQPSEAPLPAPELADHPRYRVIRLLGEGGMGAVYLAEHRLMARLVALKVVRPSLMHNAHAVERFRREVKAAARLAHPNIVSAHDAEEAGQHHFLVMEYVEGASLADVLERRGPIPVEVACDYVRQAALGLQHAHERDMVHRDLKPQNLMLTDGGLVKILDFGLARFASESPESTAGLTAPSTMMGTPDYMAPEQALDARRADIRADIYSLGCTLYCLLSGRPPFPDGTAMEKVVAHLQSEPQALSTFGVPPGVEQVVARMMAKEPAQRFQSPMEAAEALAPLAGRAEAAAGGVSPILPRAASSATAGTARWAFAAGAAALVVALGLIVVLVVTFAFFASRFFRDPESTTAPPAPTGQPTTSDAPAKVETPREHFEGLRIDVRDRGIV